MLLIVEDDPHYARILLGLARDNGFKGIVATKGAHALALARQYQPTAISLDIFLPDMLGWTVLNQLKLDPATRHIPVQIVTLEEERQHGLARGAFAYLVKEPTTDRPGGGVRPDQGVHGGAHQAAARGRGQRHRARLDRRAARRTTTSRRWRSAAARRRWRRCASRPFDCVVLDLRLPDMTGFELLEKVHAEPALADVPVVVFTGKDLTDDEHGAAQGDGQEHRPEGRAVAGAAARRDGAVPAPRRHRPAAGEAADAGAAARRQGGAARPQGAGRRRRRAQHLRPDLAARESRDGGDQRDQRPPGDRPDPAHAGPQHGADGHHDAGHGRLRDDARDPQRGARSAPCRSWRSPPRR